jgi:hypothetical protein
MTLSILAFSIMALSILAFSIITLSTTIKNGTVSTNAAFIPVMLSIVFFVMLSVVTLNVVMS